MISNVIRDVTGASEILTVPQYGCCKLSTLAHNLLQYFHNPKSVMITTPKIPLLQLTEDFSLVAAFQTSIKVH